MLPAHGLQVFPEEAEHLDETNTVVLKNGNYLFILGLHHNLHCLVSSLQLVKSARVELTLLVSDAFVKHYRPTTTILI